MRKSLLSLLMVFMVTLSAHSARVILSEGFENGFPADWTLETVTSGSVVFDWTVEDATESEYEPVGAPEGSYRIAFRKTADRKKCTQRLITPVMDCSGYRPTLSFQHAQVMDNDKFATLKIYYRGSENDGWTLMQSYDEAIDDWQLDTMGLVGATSTYQLAFEGEILAAGSGFGIVLDDILIKETPQCSDVNGLTVVPMANTAALTIFDNVADTFQVVITTAPVTDWDIFDPTQAVYYDPVETNTDVTVTGLQPQTDYYAYVRSVCRDLESGYTNWISASFRTSIGFPFAENFDSVTALPSGWQRMKGDLNAVYGGAALTLGINGWTYSSSTTVTGSNHIYSTASTTETYWMVMPAIDLTTVHADTMIDLEFYLALTSASAKTDPVTSKTGLNFYVLVSENAGETWTAPNTTTWSAAADADFDIEGVTNIPTRYRVNMNRYKGEVVQIAFVTKANSGSGYFHVDDITLAAYDPECGDAAKLQLTADMNTITANWTIYGKENAVIEIATNNSFATKLDSAIITTGTTHTFNGLTSNTLYYVRVKQDCPDASWVYGSCRTVIGMPYENPFTSTTFPVDWGRDNSGVTLQQLLSGTTLPLTSTAGWSMQAASSYFPNMGCRAVANIYGNNRYYWMVSPAIKLTDTSNDPIRLSFMAAMTEYSSTSAPEFSDNDDVFAVLISQDGGQTWLAADAHIWDADSASANPKIWDFNPVPQRVNIDLSQYRNQTIRLAFYGGSTASGSDNDMMVGNLSIDTYDGNCAGVSGLSLNTTPTSVTATWNTTGYPNVDVQLSTSSTFATLVDSAVVTTGTIQFTNLLTSTQYYLRVRQQCSHDDSDWKTQSFKTPVGLPFFDALSNLSGWTKMSGNVVDVLAGTANPTSVTSSSTGWKTDEEKQIAGISGVHAYYNIYSTSANYWLVSTPINLYVENNDPIQLSFNAGFTKWTSSGTSEDDPNVANQMLWVLASTDNGTTWQRVYLISAADSADYNINNCVKKAPLIKVPLTQYSGQTVMLAFAGNQYVDGGDNWIHLANVSLLTVNANCQGLSVLRANNVSGTSADIEWTVGGAQSLDLTVATDTAFSQIVYTGTVTGTHSLTNLASNTRYYVKARQTCDTEADWTLMMFKTKCAAQTPEDLGEMTFDDESSLDCWTLDFMTKGTSSSNALAAYAQDNTYGSGIKLEKSAANIGNTTTYNDGAYAISPELNIDSINKYQVTFNACTYKTSNTNVSRLSVGVITEPDQTDTYVQIKTIPLEYAIDSTGMSTYVVSFNDYIGDYNDQFGKYIMFMSEAGDSLTNYVFIDNVSISLADGCPQLVEHDITSLRTDSALFRWENVAANSYEVMVSMYGSRRPDTIPDSTLVFQGTTTADSIWITGLTGNTRYYAYVRAICTDGTSRWSGARGFRTECSAISTFPWTENFEGMETGVIDVDCWDMFQYAEGTGSGTSGSGFQVSTTTTGDNKTKQLYLPDMKAGEMTQLTLPVMYGAAAPGQYELLIDVYRNGSGSTKQEGLHIYASPDGTMAKAVEMGFIYRYYTMSDSVHNIPAEAASGWYTYELPIPISGYFHIIIMGESQWGSATYADNIIIRQKATCQRPTIKSVSNVTTISADVAWGGSNAGTYELQYSRDGEFGTIDGTQMVTNDSTISLTDLQPGTTYYVRVRGICSEGDMSEWSRVITAQTGFGIPFIETFNLSGTTVPSYWTIMSGAPQSAFSGTAPTSSSGGWLISNSSNGLPANHLKINIWSSTNNRWIVAPSLDLTSTVAGDSLVFSFDFAYTDYNNALDPDADADQSLWLLVSTDGGTTWTYNNSYVWTHSDTAAVTFPLSSIPTTGSHIVLDFSRFAGQNIRFAFVATTHNADNDFHIANVQLMKVIEGCDAPSNVLVEPDTYSAALTWEGDSAKMSVIQLSTAGDFTKNVRFDTVASGLAYQLTDLMPSTNYYVRVKQLCGDNEETVYSSSKSFTTACVPVSEFPWTETFENTSTSGYVIPNCWDRIAYRSSSNYVYPYVTTNSTYATSGTHVLYMYGGALTTSSSSQQAIILPEVSVNLNELLIRFNYRTGYLTDSYAKLVFGTISGTTDLTKFTALDTLPKTTTMTEYEYYLNKLDSTVTRLALVLMGGTSSSYMQTVYIDDVTLAYLPNCFDVKKVEVDNVTTTTARVSIEATDAPSFEYVLTDTAITETMSDSAMLMHVVLDTVAYDTLNLTGLTDAATYYVYVRALCDDTTFSAWSKGVAFTTECYPIATLPYNEGFESYQGGTYSTMMAGPTCWDTYTTGTTYPAPHVISSGSSYYYKHNGSKALSFYGSGYNYAVMPVFETPIAVMRMTFWMQTSSSTSGSLVLGYITEADSAFSSFTPIETFANSYNAMTQRSVDLGNVPANAYRLVFRWYYSYQTCCSIDDIQITERPKNETLLNIRAENVTRTSMDISWTPRPDSTLCKNYELVISETALNDSVLDTVPRLTIIDTTGYHAALLDRDTKYYIYARTVCDTVNGVWVSTNVSTLPMAGCGDTVIVADGTTTSPYVPFYGFYLDYDNFTQSIYPASMLTELVGRRISAIKYFVSSGGLDDIEDFGITHVRIGITSQTSLSSGFLSDPKVEVFSGELAATLADGMTITFAEPIIYQGGNIFIEFDHEEADDYASTAFYGMTATAGSSRYSYSSTNSSSSFLPKIAVATICDPSELVSCPTVDTITVELQGDGTSEAIISWSTAKGDYANGYDLFITDNDSIVPDSMTVPQYTNLTDTFMTINTLEPNKTYHVFVRVHCNAGGHDDGDSEWAETTFKTLATCAAPTNLSSVVTSKTTAEVTWDPGYAGQIADYRYIVSTTQLSDSDLISANPSTDTTGHLYLTGLTLDQQYWVYVAVDCSTELSPWQMTTFTTPANCAPVENLTIIDVRHNMVSFSWERSQFGTETMWEVGIVGDSSNVMQTADTTAVLFGLNSETTYSFYVKALCDEGETSVMSTKSFTTGVTPATCTQIGSGSSSNSYLPAYSLYKYSLTEQIYTAAEIGHSGRIFGISFYNSGTTKERIIDLYLQHTDKSQFAGGTDWETIADAPLFSDTVSFVANQWTTLEFAEPFQYNGTDNLMVIVDDNTGDWESGMTCRSYSAPSQAIRIYSDGTNYDPTDPSQYSGTVMSEKNQLQLCFETEGCVMPMELTISDTSFYSARAIWVPGSSERSWETYLSTTQMTDAKLDSVTTTVVSTPMMSWNDLTDDTDYWFYVRALCDSTHASDWVSIYFPTKAICLPPSAIVADSVTADQVWLHITSVNAAPAQGYTVVYGLAATFDLDDATTYLTADAGDTIATLNGLTGNTLYKVAVMEVCDLTHTSRISPVSTFRTECAPVVGLPWSEDFNSLSSGIPFCWDNSLGNATNPWTYYATGQTGHCVRFNSYSNQNNQKGVLMSPELTIDTTATLIFSYKNPTGGNFRVAVTTDNGVTNTTLLNNLTGASTWVECEISLNAYRGQVIRIYFEGTSNYGDGDAYIYLDDVSVIIPSPCARPDDVTAEVVDHDVVVSWTGSGVENSDYLVEYSSSSAFTGEVDSVMVHDTTAVTITGLAGARTYYFRVRSICGAYGESRVSAVVSATLGIWMPYIQDTTFTSIPSNWSRSNTTMTDAFNNVQLVDYSSGWTYAASNAVMHGSHFKINIWGTNCHYWLRMPELEINANANQSAVLSFDVALNKYNNIGTAPTETGDDDIFMVAISTDGGKHFTRQTATIWQDAAGANYSYAAIPADTVATYRVDLSAYIGQTIVIGFYGESTVSGGDNDLHLGNIRVLPMAATRYDATICDGRTYYGNGFTITPSQYGIGMNYFSRSTEATDSTEAVYEVLALEVLPLTKDTIYATVCQGAAYVYDEHIYLDAEDVMEVGLQEFPFELTSSYGCDSIIRLIVDVLPAARVIEYAATCSGIPYNWHGQDYYVGGTYVDTLQTVEGCDSICTLMLTVEDVIRRDTAVTLCYGEQIIINGQTITKSGTYLETIENPEGCDEEINWTVTAIGKLETHTRVVACKGSTYNDELIHGLTTDFHDNTTTTSKVSGCDSTVIYDIWFADANETLYVNVPENELPFVVNGVELIATGTAQGEYTRTVSTECGDVTMVISVGQAVIRYTVVVKAENGLAYGSGIYVAGEQVEIGVQPFNGYQFKSWNDGNTENPRTITVSADVTYTGTCVEIEEGLEDVIREMGEDEVLKLIENQQLIIIRNGVRYNAQGAVIE